MAQDLGHAMITQVPEKLPMCLWGPPVLEAPGGCWEGGPSWPMPQAQERLYTGTV